MSAVAIDRTYGAPPVTSGGPAAEMLVLEAVAHRLGLAPVVLVPGEITIGSGIGCDIRLQVPGVEERHCVVQCSRARISVQALDHRTWHNNLPITQSWLRLGDRLAVGPVEFRVRAVEPWDVLPSPESMRPIPATPLKPDPRPVTPASSTADQATLETSLLQQIATLEATVARHQAAVAKLIQQPTSAEVVAVPDSDSVPVPPPVDAPYVRPPLLSVATVPPRGVSVVHDERTRLLSEIEANHRESKNKLAELSVREDSLQRQFAELGTQWEQLHVLIAHQEQAAAEWSLRVRQLDSRQQQCEQRETELSSREQQLLAETELAAQRQSLLQAEAAQHSQQQASLSAREQTLGDWAGQLTLRETSLVTQFNTLEQRQAEVEQQEASYRDRLQQADANAENWNRSREATDAQLSQRAAELDAQALEQTSQADELARRQQVWEQANTQLQEELRQVETERSRLAAWRDELEASAATHAARQLADTEQFAQQQALLSDRERAAAELASQLTMREAELREQGSLLEQRRSELEQREETYRAQCQAAEANQAAWNQSRESEDAALARRREELNAEVTRASNLSAELAQRQSEWEAQVARFQEEQQQLDAERSRLSAWNIELHNSAADLAAETTGLSQRRDEFAAARVELDRVEAEVEDFERQLLEYEAELQERDAALAQAETECAWHERAWELSALQTRPVPGDVARTEERQTETLSRVIEHLTTDRDALATELFVMSTIAAEVDDDSGLSRHVKIQAEQLRRDQGALQQRTTRLVADQQVLNIDRQRLLQEQQALEHQRQQQLAAWQGQQAELAAREQELRLAGDALSARESEIAAKRNKLDGEQDSLQQLTDFMQARHEELALLRADLERQLIEVSTQVERQTNETASLTAELQLREQELDERDLALTQQEAALQAAQRELNQQRQIAERERAEWSRNRESLPEAGTPSDETSRALNSIAHLEEIVQTELDQDRDFISEVSHDSACDLTTPEDVLPLANDDSSELTAEAAATNIFDSVWNTPSAPETPPADASLQSDFAQNLTPSADDELSPSNLRAKLAEMFNIDLSSEAPATPTDSDQDTEPLEESQPDMPSAESEAMSDPIRAAEPEDEEYDSVEAYMQRLLDRNRTAVADYVASQPVQYSARTVPQDLGEAPEIEGRAESTATASENADVDAAEPTLEYLPTVRPAVDAAKVREGLLSLRQVANNSARSAIARSKWNKMRAQMAIQGALAAICVAVGGAIVTGHWMEWVGTSVWGWVAVALGIGLGMLNLLNMWSIHRFKVGQLETPAKEPKDDSPEPPESSSDEKLITD